MTEHELDPFLVAEVGEPIPDEHALGGDDRSVSVRLNDYCGTAPDFLITGSVARRISANRYLDPEERTTMSESRFKRSAEFIGVLGVIVSLAFVGWEIRQNTKVAKAEAYRSFMSELNQAYSAFNDSSFAAFQVRVADLRVSDLSSVDYMRLFGSFMVLMRTYEGLHKQVVEGVLDESALLLLSQSDWNLPIWKDIWPNISRNLTPDFKEYFERAHGYGGEPDAN